MRLENISFINVLFFYQVEFLWNFDTQHILSIDQLLSPLRIFERMLRRHQPMLKQHTKNFYLH